MITGNLNGDYDTSKVAAPSDISSLTCRPEQRHDASDGRFCRGGYDGVNKSS